MSHTRHTATYPVGLQSVCGRFRHPLLNPIRVPEDPYCELMQDTNFEANVEVSEVLEVFFGAIGAEV
jgi:hypothetical protein